ncbi:DUF5330 domain-containing protein [Cohaesibacter gelatinilyticus]|uniref:DUF5330 domain-containing protein n=1 Tax=Cohaesibacter gelatinilyticus TaxID=372072 RepID=A0A285NCB4_9HYPH|nr:DUF5330 domain-containing protein [Cohaesibacter gelatinilyticus]SNZ07095.1 hypothetical protein SAMN06265368_0655 [Cohaesibacter gelatinilyticus]HAT86998.1 hypothetical protein [Hyphomicrobiales bacterium]
MFGFLIRAAFWLSLVIMILPREPGTTREEAGLSTMEAITVAQATLNDFTGFCSRQPDVCAAGEVALETFSAKAKYGAKQLYVYLDGQENQTDRDENSGLRQAPALSEGQGLDRQELTMLAQGSE